MLGQNPPTTVVIENVTVKGGGADPWMTWVPIVVAVAALLLTATTFWWLNAYRGRLVANVPRTCAVGASSHVFLLRFPLTIYNTGARSLVVGDLRCQLTTTDIPALPWRSTRHTVRPQDGDFEDFPRSFAVGGRKAHSLVVEFGRSDPKFQLDPGVYRVVIEAIDGMSHPSDDARWMQLTSFEWHLHGDALGGRYIAHPVTPNGDTD